VKFCELISRVQLVAMLWTIGLHSRQGPNLLYIGRADPSPGLKLSERDSDQSPPFGAEVTN
jgi:hypothetical protein